MKATIRTALIAAAAVLPALVMNTQAHAVANTGFSYLSRGQSLFPPNYLYPPSRNAYYVIMQDDGNLVEYGTSSADGTERACWSTQTQGHPGAYASYQNSGNLVIQDQLGQIIWSSRTVGLPGSDVNVTDLGSFWVGTTEIVGAEPACNGPHP